MATIMQGLPFLVVYGGIVAKVLVVVGVCAIWRYRRAGALANARSAQLLKLAEIGPPKEGAACVRGILRERGDRRWLDCTNTSITLLGEIRVVDGKVCNGADVVASGQITREAAGYRDPSAQESWVMTPSPPLPSIELSASLPPITVPWPTWRVLLLYAVVSYGAWFGIGALVRAVVTGPGERSAEACNRALHELAPTSFLAALPGMREDALAEVERRLNRFSDGGGLVVKRGIARLRRGCPGEASVLMDEDFFEEAYKLAMTCDAREVAVKSLLALGRYEDAAQVLPAGLPLDEEWTQLAEVAMIGAGHWRDLAEFEERRIEQTGWWLIKPDYEYQILDWAKFTASINETVLKAKCRAELFRTLGGDINAPQRLHALVQSTTSSVCTVPENLARGTDHEWLDGLLKEPPPRHDDWDMYASSLSYPNTTPWLVPFALARPGAPPYGKWQAVYHALIGDTAAIQRDVVAIRATSPDPRLERALQMWVGAPLGGDDLANPAQLEVETGAVTEREDVVERSLSPAEQPAFHLLRELANLDLVDSYSLGLWDAMRGDGGVLAEAIQDYPGFPSLGSRTWVTHAILAVQPYVVTHRTELRAALRDFRPGIAQGMSVEYHWHPSALVLGAAIMRDLMRASGNVDLAAHWQDIVNRHARMLSDPERGRIFALLQVE